MKSLEKMSFRLRLFSNLSETLLNIIRQWKGHLERMSDSRPVSYTHLDVYKRQETNSVESKVNSKRI